MEAKATDERFFTPRSSARRGYSSAGSEDERFTSPRTSARSVSSDENDYTTPREGSVYSPRDVAVHPTRAIPSSDEFYKHQAIGKSSTRLNMSELKPSLPDAVEYKAQAFGSARRTPTPTLAFSSSPRGAVRSPRDVVIEAPAVSENDIFSAARHNRIDSVAYMLDQGVSVNLRGTYGNTILSIACQNGLKRMAKLALRRGANINSANVSVPAFGGGMTLQYEMMDS